MNNPRTLPQSGLTWSMFQQFIQQHTANDDMARALRANGQGSASRSEPINLCSEDEEEAKPSMPASEHADAAEQSASIGSTVKQEASDQDDAGAMYSDEPDVPMAVEGALRIKRETHKEMSSADTPLQLPRPLNVADGPPSEDEERNDKSKKDDVDVSHLWKNEYWVGSDEDMIHTYGFTSPPPRQAALTYAEWIRLNHDAIVHEHRTNAAGRQIDPAHAIAAAAAAAAAASRTSTKKFELGGQNRCLRCIEQNLRCVCMLEGPRGLRTHIVCEACRAVYRKGFQCGVDPLACGLNAHQAAEELQRRAKSKAGGERCHKNKKIRKEEEIKRCAKARAHDKAGRFVANEGTSGSGIKLPRRAAQVAEEPTVQASPTPAVSLKTQPTGVALMALLRTISRLDLLAASKAHVLSALTAVDDGQELRVYIAVIEQSFAECSDVSGLVLAHSALRNAGMY